MIRTRGAAATFVALVVGLAGLGVATYLTLEHYDHSVTLACPESSTINCAKVTTSKWSEVAGVPVAVAGLAYFVVMLGLLVISLRSERFADLALLAAGVGMLSVLYLVGVELLAIGAICLWCTAVHVLTLIMFVTLLWRRLSPQLAEAT